MYAIVLDLDTDILKESYHCPSYHNAYGDIRTFLAGRHFRWRQGTVYFGGADVDAVKTVLAAQDLSRAFPWFAPAVRDIRMLRIVEDNDLLPVLSRVTILPYLSDSQDDSADAGDQIEQDGLWAGNE